MGTRITDDIAIAATGKMRGLGVKHLLDRRGTYIQITEEVVEAAAENEIWEDKVAVAII